MVPIKTIKTIILIIILVFEKEHCFRQFVKSWQEIKRWIPVKCSLFMIVS